MQNFIDLLNDVVVNGVDKADRTGIGSRAVFGRLLRWDLAQGFPIITTRKVAMRIAFEETMFFLRGETNTKLLEEKKINIWKGNTTREFLDKRGLTNLPEGDMGKGYGYQWRHWETTHNEIILGTGANQHSVYSIKETDQIKDLLDGIKKDPLGRRHVVTGWNPGQLNEMALPPCHMLQMHSVGPSTGEFTIGGNKLHTCFVMRSNDVPYGLPYNIMGYALLNHIFAKHLNMVPGDLVYMGWDVHIYQNQMDMVKEQLTRTPLALPTININKDLTTLDDILNLQWADIELIGYNPHPDILDKPEMAK
jgi:thymidylate synthase